MIYCIFGKKIKINIECLETKYILEKELSIYPQSNKNTSDIDIYFVEKLLLDEIYSSSPAIHKTFKNGFLANFGSNKILFKKEEKLKIYIQINKTKNFLGKFRSIGYRYNIENVGQILHELILVPINFFYSDRALIHASSMKNLNTNKTLMFGGTGGVGKTSLELLLCKELDYSFISDDIAIVVDKKVFPNLSYPKIYAYNVEENKNFENLLFKGRNLIDKIQWNFLKKFKGLNRVRRAISPDKIYSSIEIEGNNIDEYYLLFRTNNVNSVEFEEINYNQASQLTLDIIKNEYHSVLQHITWHEYNANLMNFESILNTEQIYSNWLNTYMNMFKNIKSTIVKIPIDIQHDEFLSQMRDRFK